MKSFNLVSYVSSYYHVHTRNAQFGYFLLMLNVEFLLFFSTRGRENVTLMENQRSPMPRSVAVTPEHRTYL